ncbi:MAG: translocation/assembly module TamB domain-containing protein, partial [Pseudomonadota bacterium]
MTRHVWLRRIATGVLILLILVVILLGILLATPVGTSLAQTVATRYAPSNIQVGEMSGTFLSGVTIDEIRIGQPNGDVVITSVYVEIEPSVIFAPTDIDVTSLHVGGVDIYDTTSPKPEAQPTFELPATPTVDVPVTVQIADLRIGAVAHHRAGQSVELLTSLSATVGVRRHTIDITALRLLTPQADVSGRLAATLDAQSEVDAALRWSAALGDDIDAAGVLTVTGSRSGLQLTHELASPYELQTTGTLIALANELPEVSLVTRGAAIDLSGLTRQFGVREWVLRLDGTPQAWQIESAGTSDTSFINEVPFRASATGSSEGISVLRMRVGDDRTGVASVDGSLSWSETLDVDLGATVDALQLPVFTPLDGEISANVTLRSKDAASGALTGALSDVSGTLSDQPIKGEGTLVSRSFADAQGDLTLTVGADRIQAEWSIVDGESVTADVAVTVADMSRYRPDVVGSVVLAGNIDGDWQDPDVSVFIESEQLRVRETVVQDVRASVQGSRLDHALTLSTQAATIGGIEIAARGGIDRDRWQGTVDRLMVNIEGALPAIALEQLTMTAPTPVLLSTSGTNIDELCLSSAIGDERTRESGLWCFDGGFDAQQIDASVSVKNQRLRYGQTSAVSLDGLLQLQGDITGTLQSPAAALRIALDEASVIERRSNAQTATAFTAFDVQAVLRNDRLVVTPDIRLEDRLKVAGSVTVSSCCASKATVGGNIAVDVDDLQSLNAFQDLARFGEGAAQVTVQTSGALSAPSLDMRIDLSDGDFELLPTGVRYRDVTLSAQSQSPERVVWSASAATETGTLAIDGSALFGKSVDTQVNATIDMRDATVLKLPDIAATASAQIELDWSPSATSIKGDVNFVESAVTLVELPEGSVALSPDIQQAGDQNATASKLSIDLDVDLGKNTRLEGFGLAATVGGALRLQQRPTSGLSGYGTLQLSDATYRAYGQSLDVTRGQLRFSGPLESPSLDVQAQRNVDAQVV